ncbi:hypothetical protein [Salinimicrobium xinjiangense]|uniref:hypothetical protein n=1 Tax=Salinimicrobium xinjiangense TaxID=438596 RepID=UPI00048D1C33|nr:hypothetical protein [Salinimicrobium xinjiangense]
MKPFLIFVIFLFIGLNSRAQEFSVSEGFYIGSLDIKPSLSLLAPEFPESKFTLTEVNFNKEKKREVNIVAMMEKERYERESSYIELESPMPNLSKGEKTLIEVTNDIRFHDRSSNFDIYTGEKKIPAYQEMRVPLFSSPYYSRSRARGYISPYYY